MKKCLTFGVILGSFLVGYYQWPFEKLAQQKANQKTQFQENEAGTESLNSNHNNMKNFPTAVEAGHKGSWLSFFASETKKISAAADLEKDLWNEQLNSCIGDQSPLFSASDRMEKISDLYDRLLLKFGNPEEDVLMLEEKQIKMTDGSVRTIRWEPGKEGDRGNIYWYAGEQKGEPILLDLPPHFSGDLKMSDFERLTSEGELLNTLQSRHLKYDDQLDVGLIITNKKISGLSLEINQKEVHCQEQGDSTVECECLTGLMESPEEN